MRELAPASVVVLMRAEPLGRALVPGLPQVHARMREAAESEKGSVEVVHAPAPVPRPVRVLVLVEEAHGLADGRVRRRPPEEPERFEDAARYVLAARVDHRVVVGERDEREYL